MSLDAIGVALRVARTLESIGVDYVIGGSMASSVAGEPRSTLDVDFVVRLTEDRIDRLVTALEGEFFVDALALRRAVQERSSANLIHAHSAMKVDFFVLGPSPHEQEQMSRRMRVRVGDDPGDLLYVCSPEDVVVQKLRWFRLGGETSDRQWRDVLGVLRLSATRLDRAYLAQSAAAFGVSDLLGRAESETSGGS